MIILGLHFGHDSSICLLKDGKILAFLEIERIRKIKHTIGIKYEEIKLLLNANNLLLEDIDCATITSTQLVEEIIFDSNKLDILFSKHPKDKLFSYLYDEAKVTHEDFIKTGKGWLKSILANNNLPHPYKLMVPKDNDILDKKFLLNFENFISTNIWQEQKKFSEISKTKYANLINKNIQYGFHYPVTLKLKDLTIPAYFFSHHYSHLAFSYYFSNFDDSALLSNDGAGGSYEPWNGGGYFGYGIDNKIYMLTPNSINAGEIYDYASMALGFKDSGGAGKLMGLAAYGKPIFYDEKFVGNWFDNEKKSTNVWIDHCLKMAEKNYNIKNFGKQDLILDKINVDFASSTQKLIEEILKKSANVLDQLLINSEIKTKNLCLSGGTFLNCPANSKIYNETKYKNIFIPPALADMGLSIGSAMALFTLLGHKQPLVSHENIAYLGLNSSCSEELIIEALNSFDSKISFFKSENIHNLIAEKLSKNSIVAIMNGQSEIGPRALCHRSILANPCFYENIETVNKIKNRENWRPFAPVILEGKEKEYFKNCPFPSYYMLFNAEVINDKIPAVTHIDKTARIQSISNKNEYIYKILTEFEKITQIPVLLNTSFNDKNQPIIEYPMDAINYFLKSKIDFLAIENYLISKNEIK